MNPMYVLMHPASVSWLDGIRDGLFPVGCKHSLPSRHFSKRFLFAERLSVGFFLPRAVFWQGSRV